MSGMSSRTAVARITAKSVLLAALALAAIGFGATQASAGDEGVLLYGFDLRGAAGAVSNQGTQLPGTPLVLQGAYSSTPEGTIFDGDVAGLSSGGTVDNGAASSIDVAGSSAFGVSARVAPDATSGRCALDSQNITQIGDFTAEIQIKLQISQCNEAGEYQAQCRIRGRDSFLRTPILSGPRVLQSGQMYDISCIKTPDGDNTQVTIETVNTTTGEVSTSQFSVAPTGQLLGEQRLAIGNRSPIPSNAGNTDQFTGTLAEVRYCSGDSVDQVGACLDLGGPVEEPVVEPPAEDPVVPAEPEVPPIEEIVPEEFVVVQGVRDGAAQVAPKWTSTPWVATTTGTISLTHDWDNADADIRVHVFNEAAELVARTGSGDDLGVTVEFDVVEGETYRVNVWSVVGVANQTLTLVVP